MLALWRSAQHKAAAPACRTRLACPLPPACRRAADVRCVCRRSTLQGMPAGEPVTQKSIEDWEKSSVEDVGSKVLLEELFQLADKDGNGRIDREELQALLRDEHCGLQSITLDWLRDIDAGTVIRSFDADGSADLTFDEFASLARAGSLLEGKLQEYQRAFDAADTSGNGTIGAGEIEELFRQLGQPLKPMKLFSIFESCDRDGDGQLNFPEFLEMFRGELLDLKEILTYLELNPRHVSPEASERKLVEARLGEITMIFSEAELDCLLEEHAHRVTVLEASLTWCRPCKGFERQYKRFAEAYPKTLFLKFYGNSNANTKHLIEQRLTVGRTPTFTLFSQGEIVAYATGANAGRLQEALQEHLAEEHNPLAGKSAFQAQVWRAKLGLSS